MSAALKDYTTRCHGNEDVHPSSYHQKKEPWDRLLAGALLVISSPLQLLLLMLVRATSRGDAIYKQVRVGRQGRRFMVYKIRTMYIDAEAMGGPQWAVRHDSRITPVGRALRFLHLDELPQLVNVVRGEMSLIGPRPERPEFVDRLSRAVPGYGDRLKVLPGITGLAQINLPPDDSLDSVFKKTIIDREYVDNASAILDLRILICTALRMLGIRHGLAPRWLKVEYEFPETGPLLDDTVYNASALEDTAVDIPAFSNGTSRIHGGKAGAHETPAYALAGVANGQRSVNGDASVVAPNRPR